VRHELLSSNFRIAATVLLTVLLVSIGIMNLRDRSAWLDPTDGVYWIETDLGLQAAEVEPNGPAGQAGIRPGDRLLTINGQLLPSLKEYYPFLYQFSGHALASYVVASGSETRAVAVELGSKALLTPKDWLKSLLAFLYLGIGLFVIIRAGRQPQAGHFYLLCLAAFVAYLYSWTPKLDLLDWIVYWLSDAAFLLLPALFIHFCLRFPFKFDSSRARAWIPYGTAVCLGVLQILWITGHLAGYGLPRTVHSSEWLDRFQLVYFCAGFLAGGILLVKGWIGATELTTRQQMKWVSSGTLSAIIPFSLIYAIPVLLGVRANLAMEFSLLFLGLIPLTFAYAIIHYRLLDVETILRRGATYFIASTALLAFYLFLVLVVGKGLEWIAPQADFLVVCVAALAIALLFAPLREKIQDRLDRLFYKDRFKDRSSLLEFARTLSSEITLERLSRRVLERISTTFQLDRVALFLLDPIHPGFYRLTDSIGLDGAEGGGPLHPVEDLLENTGPGDFTSSHSGHQLCRAAAALSNRGFGYVLELKLRGRRIGLIGLGAFTRSNHFTTEDVDLLTALAGYAAIALENANLYHSIQIKAMEFERLKIYTENIIECINVGVLALDLSGSITSCNRAFEVLYDVGREQIQGKAIESLLAKDVLTAIRKVTGTIGWELKAPGNIFKMFLENRKGEKLIVNLSIIPLFDSMDMNTGSLIVMDDITAKVHLEDQLMQAEKLSSIGLLAAGIAHEVNTPITGISSYTQMLLKEIPETDRRKPILEKIEKQTFRAAEIVNGLLNFARLNGSEYRDIDVNLLIQESLSLLDHQLNQSHIRLKPSLDASLPPIFGNGGKLQQVFINLFLNARDAMPSGGELEIETSLNDSMVIVDIRDTGIGISEEDIKRIYDPFFTTKGTGRGTGLGLAVTYGIIQEHGGRILVDSMPGKGTHFRLKLPTRKLQRTAS